MTTVAYPGTTGQTGVTDAANFIPEIWSDDIIAAYKSNLVLANLVNKINHKGKKGDTIHIPSPTRDDASAKAENTAVSIIANTEGVTNISIDKHYEYSRLIEDIVSVQGLSSLRRFYTDDAGYALAKQIDRSLSAVWDLFQGGNTTANTGWEGAVSGADGTTLFSDTAYTGSGDLTDAAIRNLIQTLDDTDTPMTGRSLVLPPSQRNVMMGLSRFTEQAFTGESGSGNTIRNGQIGNVYGVDVFVTTNCPWASIDGAGYVGAPDLATAYTDVDYSAGATGTDVIGDTYDMSAAAATDHRIGAMFHKDALVLVEQMGVRSQTQYKQEYLADLMTTDCIYGVGELRDTGGVAFATPA